MINLDYYCMKFGQKIGCMKGDQESNIRKALGVLKEDGVYAMFLWLEYRDKGKIRKDGLLSFLNDEEIKGLFLDKDDQFPENFEKFCSKIQEVAGDLDKLFLFKKLLERTLTYALYHAKVGAGE